MPGWIWIWGAFDLACVAIPLITQMDWKALVIGYQTLIIAVLAVVAALGTLLQLLANGHEYDNRRQAEPVSARSLAEAKNLHEAWSDS